MRHVGSFNVKTVWKWIWATTLVCNFDILNYGEKQSAVWCHQTNYLNYFNQKSTQNQSNTSRSRREFKSHNWMVKVLLKQRKWIINSNHLSIPIHFESNRINDFVKLSMVIWCVPHRKRRDVYVVFVIMTKVYRSTLIGSPRWNAIIDIRAHTQTRARVQFSTTRFVQSDNRIRVACVFQPAQQTTLLIFFSLSMFLQSLRMGFFHLLVYFKLHVIVDVVVFFFRRRMWFVCMCV